MINYCSTYLFSSTTIIQIFSSNDKSERRVVWVELLYQFMMTNIYIFRDAEKCVCVVRALRAAGFGSKLDARLGGLLWSVPFNTIASSPWHWRFGNVWTKTECVGNYKIQQILNTFFKCKIFYYLEIIEVSKMLGKIIQSQHVPSNSTCTYHNRPNISLYKICMECSQDFISYVIQRLEMTQFCPVTGEWTNKLYIS